MQVVVGGLGGGAMLEYKVGDILTVLDRSGTSGDPMWTGVNGVGKVGWFVPSHTVTYLGDLPTSSAMSGIDKSEYSTTRHKHP